MIAIRRDLSIPESELRLTVSRSGGPGGQHVNKVSTRVALEFDVDGSPSLTGDQKRKIRERLGPRLSRAGRLRLTCGLHRSQAANRREVVERFVRLVGEALRPRRRRVATGVPPAERGRRREEKRRRSRLKRQRSIAGEE